MSDLRDRANAKAQEALRACHDYRISHGEVSRELDATYEASERMVEAVEEFERLEALAHDAVEDAVYAPGPFFLPDVPLADPGDHHVFPAGVGL